MSYDLVRMLRKELDKLLTHLRKELEGKTSSSPEAWTLLRNATREIEHSRAALAQATTEIERLAAELARRKPPGDDGVAELVPVEPPKRPSGGSPAFATRPDSAGDSASGVQEKVLVVRETDKAMDVRFTALERPERSGANLA
jgi:hypothetical protein